MLDFDRFSRHDPIGEVQIQLNAVDFGQVTRQIAELLPPPTDRDSVRLLNMFVFLDRYLLLYRTTN